MDEKLLINTCKDYYDNFKCKEENNKVAYAGKAFLTKAMCKLVEEQGLYLDVVSGGELFTAYKAGFPLNKVYFHGNNKSRGEIELGVKLGVGRFVVDNLSEMKMLNKVMIIANLVLIIFMTIRYYKKLGSDVIIITVYTAICISNIIMSVFLMK